MPKTKRTIQELKMEILEAVGKLEEIQEEAKKTTLANAVGINNALATSTLDAMKAEKLIETCGGKQYKTSKYGKLLMKFTKLNKDEKEIVLEIGLHGAGVLI